MAVVVIVAVLIMIFFNCMVGGGIWGVGSGS